MDCILEDTVASSVGQPATASARVSGRRGSRIPSGSRGNSRRGSSTDLQDTAAVAANLIDSVDSTSGGVVDKANMFSYWLQVSIAPQVYTVCPTNILTNSDSILQYSKSYISKSKTCFENLVKKSFRWHLEIKKK